MVFIYIHCTYLLMVCALTVQHLFFISCYRLRSSFPVKPKGGRIIGKSAEYKKHHFHHYNKVSADTGMWMCACCCEYSGRPRTIRRGPYKYTRLFEKCDSPILRVFTALSRKVAGKSHRQSSPRFCEKFEGGNSKVSQFPRFFILNLNYSFTISERIWVSE